MKTHWMWEIQILRQTPQGEYYTYKYMLTPPGTYILALRYLLSLGAQTISSLPNNVLSIIYIDVELVCHIEKVELS